MSQRINYQKELENLHQSMIRMGSDVEESIHLAVLALTENDVELATKVIDRDDIIDDQERKITQECILLIARQQPVASDLRNIAANMKLVTDLERVADHAEDIAEHVVFLNDKNYSVVVPHDVVKLTEHTLKMIHAVLDAYVESNLDKAKQIVMMDIRVNALYGKLKKYLVRQMKLDPEGAPAMVEMLLVCKHLERIGDHAKNIAEWIVYFIEGEYITSSEIRKEVESNEKGRGSSE
ncbi:MAG TPA: phosphate signaling complex protein PhoU [Clostridiaceae bacterium]|nr:phosphate signaling complex protein PhoU [Clostridiaceae bacterium]